MTTNPTRDLDVIALGSIMAEISPPDNRTRVTEADSLVMVQAGSATTFALAFQKLGGSLGFISRLGADEVGEWIRRSLEAEGVDTSEVRTVPGQLTPISLASVDASGKKTFAYYRFPGYSEPLGTLKSEEVSDDYLTSLDHLRSHREQPAFDRFARGGTRAGSSLPCAGRQGLREPELSPDCLERRTTGSGAGVAGSDGTRRSGHHERRGGITHLRRIRL